MSVERHEANAPLRVLAHGLRDVELACRDTIVAHLVLVVRLLVAAHALRDLPCIRPPGKQLLLIGVGRSPALPSPSLQNL
jgi:hypothetical protein